MCLWPGRSGRMSRFEVIFEEAVRRGLYSDWIWPDWKKNGSLFGTMVVGDASCGPVDCLVWFSHRSIEDGMFKRGDVGFEIWDRNVKKGLIHRSKHVRFKSYNVRLTFPRIRWKSLLSKGELVGNWLVKKKRLVFKQKLG